MTSRDSNRPNSFEGSPIVSEGGLLALTDSLEGAGTVAVVIETPRQEVATLSGTSRGEARLISVASREGGGGVVDVTQVDPASLLDALRDKTLVVHDALACAGPLLELGLDLAEAPAVIDTLVMSRLLEGGTGDTEEGSQGGGMTSLHRNLETVARHGMGAKLGPHRRTLGRNETRADILLRIADAFESRIAEARLARVWDIERRALPALVRMALSGMPFDTGRWREHLRQVKREVAELGRLLDVNSDARPDGKKWNWASPKQVKEAFALDGTLLPDTRDETLARCASPLAYLLRKHRKASKLLTGFGANLLGHARGDGRIYASWHQVGTATGRMSCSDPNLQQLPKEGVIRRYVRAPRGRALVAADYAQAELRILGQAAGEPTLLRAFGAGEDPYLAMAASMFAVGKDAVAEGQRDRAKVVTLSIIYGKGAWGLSRELDVDLRSARGLLDRYFAAHPKVRAYLNGVSGEALDAGEVRTPTGRVRRFGGPSAKGNRAETRRQAANFPMQAGCADVLKLALALLHERRGEHPDAVPVLLVHDEIVVECGEGEVEGVAAWLARAMTDAMAEVLAGYDTDGAGRVPAAVEVKGGSTWGGCVPLVPETPAPDGREELGPVDDLDWSETSGVRLYVDYRDPSAGNYPSAVFCDGCAEGLDNAIEFQDDLESGCGAACGGCGRVG